MVLAYDFSVLTKAASFGFFEDFITTTNVDLTTLTAKIASGNVTLKGKEFLGDMLARGYSALFPGLTIVSDSLDYKIAKDGTIHVVAWDGTQVVYTKWFSKSQGWRQAENFGNYNTISANGYAPFIQLDGQNNPYIIWIDTVTSDLFFTRWDGTNWVKMDGSLGDENVSNTGNASCGYSDQGINCDFKLASDNNPYIVWQDNDGDQEVYFSYWDGASWSGLDNTDGFAGYDNLSNDAFFAQPYPILQLDSQTIPYVAWDNSSNLNFTKWTPGTGWTGMDGVTLGSDDITLAGTSSNDYGKKFLLTKDNIPYLTYADCSYTTYACYIIFTKYTAGTGWTGMDGVAVNDTIIADITQNIDYYQPDLAIDSQNNAYIVTEAYAGGLTRYIEFTKGIPGSSIWTKMDGSAGPEIISPGIRERYPKIEVDANGNPAVIWQDQNISPRQVGFTKWVTGTGWVDIKNNPGSDYPFSSFLDSSSVGAYHYNYLQLDALGRPFIIAPAIDLALNNVTAIVAGMDGVGWQDINQDLTFNELPFTVGNNALFTQIDSAGNYYLTTGSSFPAEVFLTRWDQTACNGAGCYVKMDGTPGVEVISSPGIGVSKVVLRFNSLDEPYLLWHDNGTLYFLRWSPGIGAGVCGGVITDCWTDMAQASTTPDNLGSTQDNEYDLAIDSADNPYVVYRDTGTPPDQISFKKWSGASWTGMDGISAWDVVSASNGVINSQPFIKLTSTDVPYIAWRTGDNIIIGNNIAFAKYTVGTGWTGMAGAPVGYDDLSNDIGKFCTFTDYINERDDDVFIIDSADNPHIIFSCEDDSLTKTSVYYSKWSGAAWTDMDNVTLAPIEINDQPGSTVYYQNFALDIAGNPYVNWMDDISEQRVTRWSPGIGAGVCGGIITDCWTDISQSAPGTAIIPATAGDFTYENHIRLDSLDNVYVVYLDNNSDLRLARWSGAGWTNVAGSLFGAENISNGQYSISGEIRLNFDSLNNPIIAFDPSSAFSGYYSVRYNPNYLPSGQVVSGLLATTAQDILSATLTPTQTLNGQTILYYLSNNNGQSYEPVIPSVSHIFNSVGKNLKWFAVLQTTNPAVTPVIDDLAINYVTADAGGGGGTPIGQGLPNVPQNLTCQASGSDQIRWSFTDMATNEDGFRLYGPAGKIYDTGDVLTPDLSYIDEANLHPNTQYSDRYVVTFNGVGESGQSNLANCYTLANKPLLPEAGPITGDKIVIKINPGDNNPSWTEYAIKEMQTGKYVQADGSFGDQEYWRTYEQWGGLNGFTIVGGSAPLALNSNVNAQFSISLVPGQTYNFAVKARNGAGVETALSDPLYATTQTFVPSASQISAAKGVAIALARNEDFLGGLVRIAQAGNNQFFSAEVGLNPPFILRQVLILFSLLALLFLLLLVLSLRVGVLHLDQEAGLVKKLKMAWHIIRHESVKVYKSNAQRNKQGIYIPSFDKHNFFHQVSRKNLARILTLIVGDIMILTLLVISFNHQGVAQVLNYNQSGQEVKVGDKLSYVIEIENKGTGAGNNVVVNDTLSSRLSYVSGTAKIRRSNQEITSGINVNGNNLSFSLGSVASNEIVDVLLTAQVNAGSEGQVITNSGQISGDNFTSFSTNTTTNGVEQAVVVPPLAEPTNTNLPPVAPSSNTNVPPIVPPLLTNNTNVPPSNTNLPPTTQPGGNINVPVMPATQPQPGTIIGSLFENETVQLVAEFFTSEQTKTNSQNVVTPILLGLAAINTLPTVLILTSYLLPYLNLLFVEPLLLFFRKKRQKWGVVYDSLTKLPIGLALVRLYNKADNRLLQTKVTDREGRYIMIVNEPGSYYLSITKPGYEYPSRYLHDEKQDTKFIDLYHGEEIEVKEAGQVVTANVPVDPQDKKIVPTGVVVRQYLLNNLRLIISYLGIILALVVVLIYPTPITIGSLAFHVLMFVLFRRLIIPPKPKSWGIIYDENRKQPLHYAVVRIFDTKFNKLLETQVTDAKGRYSFLVGKNEYQLLAEKQGYQPRAIKPVDLISKEAIVSLDVGLKKTIL